MAEHDNKDISLIIDRALSSYIPENEPLGLPRRVLGRIGEKVRSRQQRRWPLFMFAFASLCVALIALVAIPGSRSLRSRSATQALVPPVSPGAERYERKAVLPANEYKRANASSTITVRRRFPGVSPVSGPRHALPKLEQFPAPAPLTNEERALLQLSAGSAEHLFANKQSSSIDPIHIEPLRINPL